MKDAAYTSCNGREDQLCISTKTRSVMRLTVSFETEAPHASAERAEISLVANPLAYNEIATVSTSLRRRCRILTITGSIFPARSRGTSICALPAASVNGPDGLLEPAQRPRPARPLAGEDRTWVPSASSSRS
jgi:hypothetical protein